ncbi:hypothetical protein EV651_102291 [Kribbella sp. VKM Ac-2571]|uniref:hypothetical protein n=1 Tax=Kribbella sp. VKM Ac-2571 TaxID=2512222 RepID=UPI00105BA7E8|nr:hypothetical protein [Kribbella sp. VKM Ac-2571]TDO68372.1 hypothetical protein EV651_102291 [Kribbella sp. VKM Ac-2571]
MAEKQPERRFQVLLSEGAVQDLNRMRDAAAAEAEQYPDDKSPAHNANRTLFKGVLRNAGGTNARDVIAIGPRHASENNAYQQTAMRLGRSANQSLPQLDRFGAAQVGSGGKAHQRNPVLDANRAIAHAFDGQTPLSGSRPLSETAFGSRGSSGGAKQAGKQASRPANPQRGD